MNRLARPGSAPLIPALPGRADPVRNQQPMTPQQFIAKRKKANPAERSAYPQHFPNLCELLDQPTPVEGGASQRRSVHG